jgi:fibronectin-binding autotransporter adhesin
MKTSLRLLTRVSILAGSIAALTAPSHAASLIWDADGVANATVGGTGTWDTATPLWFLNGGYVPWNNATNAADTAVFGGIGTPTVTLGAPISAGGLQFNSTGYTVAGGANAITLANNAVIGTNFAATGSTTINAALGGTNLVFNALTVNAATPTAGQGRIILGNNTTNTGTTTINGGMLELNNGVTMTTGTGIVVNGSGLYHPSALTGVDYPFHRLRLGALRINGTGDIFGSQMVTLNGGTIVRVSPAGGNDTATIQNLTAATGDNILASGPSGANAGDVLAITNLTRNSTATIEFRSQYGVLGGNGDNGKVSIGTLNGVAVANTNGILGGWAYANLSPGGGQGSDFSLAFGTYNGANGSVTAAVPDKSSAATGGTAVNQSLAAAVAADNWLANTNNANNTITADTTINSLIEESDVIVNGGATLKIGSGGIIFRTASFWLQSGSSDGKITSLEANGNLFVNAANTLEGLPDQRIRVRVVNNGATPVRLVKAGNGTVQIGIYNGGGTTGNSYTGGTVIQMGRLQAAAVDAFGTGTVTVLPGGQAHLTAVGTYTNAFDLSGYGAAETTGQFGALRMVNGAIASGPVTLSGSTRVNVTTNTETGTLSGVISGGSGFEKTGAGVLLLNGAGANTYAGDTLISEGTLRVGKALAFGPVAAGSVLVRGGALDLNNVDLSTKILDIQGTGIAGAGAIINSAAGFTNGVQRLQLSANATIGGAGRWDVRGTGSTVTLNGFTLTKTGANLISLVTASVGAGNIVVNQGNLGLEAGTSVLAALGSSVQVNAGGFLWVHDFGSAITLTRDLTLNGGELTSNAGGANGNSVIGSNIAVPIASTINVADAGATMRLTGNISGAGAVSKIGNGTLRVDGNITGIPTLNSAGGNVQLNGTLSGPAAVNINGGKLTLSAISDLPAGATTTIASGAQLERLGGALSIPGTSTLVVGRSGVAATDVIGSLSFAAGSTLNVGGTSLARTATLANNLTLSGATVRFDLGSATTPGAGVNDLVAVTGTLDVSGGNITVALTQLGALAAGNYTLFTAGTLVGDASKFNAIPSLPNSRQTLTFNTTLVPNSVLLVAAGSKTLTWVGGLAGNSWDVNTTANFNDGVAADTFYNADSVTFGDAGAGTVALNGTLLPGSTTVNATANYTFAGPGVLSGQGTLNKQGTGTLIIANTGANDFSGTTTVSGGVLQIGDGTNGKLGTGAVVNNASVVVNLPEGATFGNTVSGTGALTKVGNTTLNLTGANTYTGATNINAGTVSVATVANGGVASPLGAGANTADKLVVDGGTLRYTGATASTDRLFSVGVAGGTLDASGAGPLTFTNGGALGFTGSGARTLTLTGSNTGANTAGFGIANGTGGNTALVKAGAGTWVLTGANTLTGGVTVNQGILAVDGSQQTNRLPANAAVTINNTGIFEMRGVNSLPTGTNGINPTVNTGGILRVVTGGSTATGTAGESHDHLNNVTLNGGTLQMTYSGTGTAYDLESFQLNGTIFVTGTTPSFITSTVPTTQQGIGLVASSRFDVADVTNSAANDLTVSADIENAAALVKNGAGTMVLLSQTTYTGGTTVNAGVLAVDAAGGGNLLVNNAQVTAQNTGVFEIRGVNALPTAANAIDVTLSTGGTFRVMSGTSAASTGGSHAHVRNLVLNGGNVDLQYAGTGTAYDGESFQLNGTVTVGGTTMSVISAGVGTTLATQGISLPGNHTFNVADATAGTDLKVLAQLQNSDTTPADDGVTKTGLGTMEIAGVSDYSGPTIVSNGTFLVSGSLTGTNNLSVASGATLGGSGTIAPTGTGAIALSGNAILAPGTNGVGQLTIDSGTSSAGKVLSFFSGAKLNFELGAGSISDSVRLVNGAALDVGFVDNIITISGVPNSMSYVLFTANVGNAYDGLFVDSNVVLGGLFLDTAFTDAYPGANLGIAGNDIVLNVPEPASIATLLGGLAMLASLRRRRQA